MTEAPVLLLTTVDIGDGRHDTICIREGDHPEVVGCAHHLDGYPASYPYRMWHAHSAAAMPSQKLSWDH